MQVEKPMYGYKVEEQPGTTTITVDKRSTGSRGCLRFVNLFFTIFGAFVVSTIGSCCIANLGSTKEFNHFNGTLFIILTIVFTILLTLFFRYVLDKKSWDAFGEVIIKITKNHISINKTIYDRSHVKNIKIHWNEVYVNSSQPLQAAAARWGAQNSYAVCFSYGSKTILAVSHLTEEVANQISDAITNALDNIN